MKNLIIQFCLAVCFTGVSSAQEQEPYFVSPGDLNLKLEITRSGRDISAVMECSNLRDFDIYVPLYFINPVEELGGRKTMINNVFEIINQDHRQALYLGAMVKRVYPPPVGQCLLLERGGKIRFEVQSLRTHYRFPLLSKVVTVRYRGPLGESNLVEISLY